jgi:hypothetical protein
VEINWDRGKGTCLGDGDLGGAHRTISVPGHSVRQDGSPLAEQRGPYS